MVSITSSVGKGGSNKSSDVKRIQALINQCMQLLAPLKPLKVDGLIGNKTITAITEFQRKVVGMRLPDGRVDPGGNTLGKMNKSSKDGGMGNAAGVASSAMATAANNPNSGDGPFFPFPKLPNCDWTTEPRSYGAWRSNRTRLHAGCDLYFPVGTWIYAVHDGELTDNPKTFYLGTDQVSIYHPDLDRTIRYGEIAHGSCTLRKGDRVTAGHKLAKVGKLRGLSYSMLHLELYTGRVAPYLVSGNASKSMSKGGRAVSFCRLKSLIDPTQYLNRWKKNLPMAY